VSLFRVCGAPFLPRVDIDISSTTATAAGSKQKLSTRSLTFSLFSAVAVEVPESSPVAGSPTHRVVRLAAHSPPPSSPPFVRALWRRPLLPCIPTVPSAAASSPLNGPSPPSSLYLSRASPPIPTGSMAARSSKDLGSSPPVAMGLGAGAGATAGLARPLLHAGQGVLRFRRLTTQGAHENVEPLHIGAAPAGSGASSSRDNVVRPPSERGSSDMVGVRSRVDADHGDSC
jgi:hypothetical protein